MAGLRRARRLRGPWLQDGLALEADGRCRQSGGVRCVGFGEGARAQLISGQRRVNGWILVDDY